MKLLFNLLKFCTQNIKCRLLFGFISVFSSFFLDCDSNSFLWIPWYFPDFLSTCHLLNFKLKRRITRNQSLKTKKDQQFVYLWLLKSWQRGLYYVERLRNCISSLHVV